MSDDAATIIREQLEAYDGQKKYQGSSVYVPCCFHDETEPSCGIVIAEDTEFPVGTFHCFGCGESGPWNKFAEQAKLEPIKGWKFFKGTGSNILSREDEAKMMGLDTTVAAKIKSKATIPWPKHLEWRGYPGTLLQKLGAESFNDKATDEPMVVFPVIVNKKTKGAVRAFMFKKKGRTSYLTTEGSWIKTYGLFPFDYTKKGIKKYGYNYIILVEGPRDALRLLMMGLPAMAILGAGSLSEKKFLMAKALIGDDGMFYVMSDNDRAGKQMYKDIKKMCKSICPVERILMPNKKDPKTGKKVKYDPDNCPASYMKRIREYLMKEHPPKIKPKRKKKGAKK